MTTKISQKDYLKKYLSSGKKKHKKHKLPKRIKVVDADEEFSFLNPDDEFLELFSEDAPQIVNELNESIVPQDFNKNTDKNQKWKKLEEKCDKNDQRDIDKNNTADLSPPRQSSHSLPSQTNKISKIKKRSANSYESGDLSPERQPTSLALVKDRQFRDFSPQRHSTSLADRRDKKCSDLSPQRQSTSITVRRDKKLIDFSPQRRSTSSADRKDKKLRDLSPQRQSTSTTIRRDKKYENSKIDKESKQRNSNYGLINKNVKVDDDEIHNAFYKEDLGKDMEPVVRDSRKRNPGNSEKELLKNKIEEKTNQIYSRWGKGLTQIEDYKEKLKNDLQESSKPLARYSDDKDLDEFLKGKDRDGDPMLAYIKKNKSKNKANTPSIPVYQGLMPENRFNIRPGYRWDGVDRSNGYEKKYFEKQSKKMSNLDDAYKYSVEDM